MPRKKVTLAYITNGGARMAALKRRRLGLLKKAQELAILCDVPACAVLYTPGESAPVVWPSPEVALSLFRKMNSTEGSLKANNTMNPDKLRLKRLAKVREGYCRAIAENAELYGEVVLRGCVSGRPVSNLDFHELQSVSRALARRAQAVNSWIQKKWDGAGEGNLQTSSPPLLLTPSVKETVGHDGAEAFDVSRTECSWMDGVGEVAPPGCDQPEIYNVETLTDDFDPADWDAFNGSEMEWDVFPGSVSPSPPLQNPAPLFSPPTIDGDGFKDVPEIDDALQHQWCWTGSEGGVEAAPEAYDLTDVGGDGTSACMFTSESETEMGTWNSSTWDEFFDSF